MWKSNEIGTVKMIALIGLKFEVNQLQETFKKTHVRRTNIDNIDN